MTHLTPITLAAAATALLAGCGSAPEPEAARVVEVPIYAKDGSIIRYDVVTPAPRPQTQPEPTDTDFDGDFDLPVQKIDQDLQIDD